MSVPDRGDICWVDFSPQAGREMAYEHPAVVLTPAAYQSATGLALVVPMTTKGKGGAFEVPMVGAKRAKGFVLANELRTIDYTARNLRPFDTCPPAVFQRVIDIAEAIIQAR